MKIQPIGRTASFQGRFQKTILLQKFKEDLDPAKKELYEKIINDIEMTNDGRVFKFDKIDAAPGTDRAEVGIFQNKFLIDRTIWIPLFYSTRDRAEECFDKLNNMYKNIQITKFN